MKNMIRILGILSLLFGLLLFSYGSIKQSRVTEEEVKTEMIDGVSIEVESTHQQAANRGYTTGTVACIIGVVMLLAAGRMGRH